MAKMGNKLIALCSAAIGVVYTAGYIVTEQPSNNQDSQSVAVAAVGQVRQSADSQSTQQNQQAAEGSNNQQVQQENNQQSKDGQTQKPNQMQASSQPAASSQTQQSSNQSKYRDGTFTGSGTNRFGTVEVAITIKKGEITACKITDCSTHYPQDYIDPELPNEVVQRQSEQVDVVSGATRSTEDFEMAVNEALQQAQTRA